MERCAYLVVRMTSLILCATPSAADRDSHKSPPAAPVDFTPLPQPSSSPLGLGVEVEAGPRHANGGIGGVDVDASPPGGFLRPNLPLMRVRCLRSLCLAWHSMHRTGLAIRPVRVSSMPCKVKSKASARRPLVRQWPTLQSSAHWVKPVVAAPWIVAWQSQHPRVSVVWNTSSPHEPHVAIRLGW